MDIHTYLKSDHRKVADVTDQVVASQDRVEPATV